jgi:hypothetical protein
MQRRAGLPSGSGHVRGSLKLCDLFFDVVAAKYVNGMYAARVKGRLPEEIIESELDSRNIKYRPRDQTEMD